MLGRLEALPRRARASVSDPSGLTLRLAKRNLQVSRDAEKKRLGSRKLISGSNGLVSGPDILVLHYGGSK